MPPWTRASRVSFNALDEIYTATPFYGSTRMQVALRRRGLPVNRRRVQRLMRVMGLLDRQMGLRVAIHEPKTRGRQAQQT